MLSLSVVCEGRADRRTGCELADRVFRAEIAWLEDGLLRDICKWRGFTEAEEFLPWTRVPDLASKLKIRVGGHFRGQPGALEYQLARKALLVLNAADMLPDAIILVRDDDGKPEKRQGFHQARESVPAPMPVVIGMASPMRESWILAGFEAETDEEQRRLRDLRKELGFDPCEQSEALTASHEHDKRSPKRVLWSLTDRKPDREASCWQETDLEVLKRRGKDNGLADYLYEVKTRLVPLFSARS